LGVLARGPVLDGPDEVRVAEVRLEKRQMVMTVLHTTVRKSGMPLRKNNPWRPLIEVRLPDTLAPGGYEAVANWIGVEDLSTATPAAGATRVAATFEIRASR